MTYQGNPSKREVESMEKAAEDAGIVAIHPDKLEEPPGSIYTHF